MPILSKELLYSFVVLISSATYGQAQAYPSPTAKEICEYHHFEQTSILWSVFTAVQPLFAMFGTFLCNFIVEKCDKSRKKAVFVMAIISVAVWLLNLVIKWNIYASIVARAFLGLMVGAHSTIAPLYVVELAPDDARGFFGVLPEAGIIIAGAIENALGPSFGMLGLLGLGAALNALQAVLIWFIPESPALAVIRAQEKVQKEQANEPLFQKKYAMNIFAGVGTMVLQQFTGIGAIVTNMGPILAESGLPFDSAYQSAIATFIQFLAVFLGGVIMDKFSRRNVWILSNSGIIVFLLLFGLNSKFGWSTAIPMVSMICYLVSFGIGAGPIPWFISPEYFPNSVRSKGMMVSSCAIWLMTTIMIFVWPQMKKGMGMFGGFTFFACITVLSVIFGIFCLHEPDPREKMPEEEDSLEKFEQRQEEKEVQNVTEL